MSLRNSVHSARVVLEGYYRRRRAPRGPVPKGTIPYGLDGYYDEKGKYAIARHLAQHDEVRVWDPSDILLKLDVGEWLKNQLTSYFYGEIENAAEQLASGVADGNPDLRKKLMARQHGAAEAVGAWKKVRVSIKKEPNKVVVIKLTPSFLATKKRYGLTEDTTTVNTGSFVRPAGPMLPPVPSPGYEDAEDVMFAPKRKRLDSRPKKKRST